MLLPGTEIHIVVFIILLFELVIFFFQVVYYLSRPSDKKRLWFLLLLFLLIYYNSVSGFLPDVNIPVPITVQNIVAYTGGLLMSMYFPFYFYKAFDLTRLKFYAYGGSILFLLLPFILFFLVPYLFTGNLDMSRRLVVIIPFFYALSFLYSLTRAIISKYSEKKTDTYKEEIVGMYLGNLFWISLPVIVYFDGSQLLENSFANAGLLVMTVLFIRSAIRNARNEYNELLLSGQKLQELNTDLANKVKERTLELEQANEQLRNTFINLAHETKTPLTLVNNYLEKYIQNHSETKELSIIRSSVGKLTKDIVNFFDLEKINKGFYIYDHDQYADFSKILQENIDLFRQFCTIKNITLIANIDNSLLVKADPESLYRIINNLIENAIKYTPEGGTIDVHLKSKDDSIEFLVMDSGMGIPEEHHYKIFDPYYQINREKKNTQGMGLGLSIVKKITESLAGEIFLTRKSEEEKGTTFIVRLPRQDINMRDEVTEFLTSKKPYLDFEKLEIPEVPFDESKYSIMLVEDNISLLNYMAESFVKKYNIYVATSGEEALEKLQTIQNLDLIISDVMMDNGDGFEFYQHVFKQKKFKHIPFVFLTANTNFAQKMEGLEMGAIDYIHKPFFIDELTGKVDAILQKLYLHRQAIINQAYNSLLQENPIKETLAESKDSFETKCIEYNLTTREVDIVRLLAKGNTYKIIADNLFISDKTVAKHIQNIFEKVEVNGKMELLNKLGINISV